MAGREENYVAPFEEVPQGISQEHKTLGHKWVFLVDSDWKHMSKLLKDNNVKV